MPAIETEDGVFVWADPTGRIPGFKEAVMSNSPLPPSNPKKTCPFCQMTDVPAAATRCPHCAGDIGKHEMLNSKVCFVATATVGDYNHPDVQILRRFRNAVLLASPVGTVMVRAYYRVGPTLAEIVKRSTLLKNLSYRLLVAPAAEYARRKLGA